MQYNSDTKKNIPQLSRETLLKILDYSYDAIFAADSKGVTIYANKACETYYGAKPEEVIGKGAWESCQVWNVFPPGVAIALQANTQCTIEQHTLTGAQILNTTTIVRDEAGNIELLVSNCRDIKQLADTKKDLKQAREMLVRMKAEVTELRNKDLRDLQLVANSISMKKLLALVDRAAAVDSNILILGETGTGKSIMAKYIHNISLRKEGPFISINCAALAADIIESELFGYVGGAFTGALSKGKVGLLELAHQGTLFLDEIAELPLRVQGKILDVIQERRFVPVGGCEPKVVDCRIIAATNRDFSRIIKNGEFREDLYYRLSVVELEIQPLRQRPEDIRSLIHFFMNKFNKKYKMEHDMSHECQEMLMRYSWPGNIRELEHMIERLVIIVPDFTIEIHHLPKVFSDELRVNVPLSYADLFVDNNGAESFDDIVSGIERKLVQDAYRKHPTTRKLAQALKITQCRAQRLVQKYCKTAEV